MSAALSGSERYGLIIVVERLESLLPFGDDIKFDKQANRNNTEDGRLAALSAPFVNVGLELPQSLIPCVLGDFLILRARAFGLEVKGLD